MALNKRTKDLLKEYFFDRLSGTDVDRLVSELIGELNKIKKVEVMDIAYAVVKESKKK